MLKMLCKDSKQHHVIFHEFYSVSSLLCIAQNVRFEIPYKVLYFETPFLMIFKYYAWASYGAISNGHLGCTSLNIRSCKTLVLLPIVKYILSLSSTQPVAGKITISKRLCSWCLSNFYIIS